MNLFLTEKEVMNTIHNTKKVNKVLSIKSHKPVFSAIEDFKGLNGTPDTLFFTNPPKLDEDGLKGGDHLPTF